MTALEPETLRVLTTGDGSPTLQRVDTGWTYRSDRGALRESAHVFVAGADLRGRAHVRVLELGFGVGTNFAALVVAARAGGIDSLDVHAVERSPVPSALLPVFDAQAHALAVAAAAHGHAAAHGVSLTLHPGEFEAHAPQGVFDAVWLDPFGPDAEPESWSVDVAKVVARALAPGGRAVTYSAAGWVRRNLAAAGLFVATVPGPIEGKREFTIAAHTPERLGSVKVRNAPR
ncbi:MAG: tRNA (5-methylaminomethyl-2-thiouridine)(34)-methyltransferase MnmD [Nannocystaceae bacterium]|nr:MnmC family methyltransferase [bacterium]